MMVTLVVSPVMMLPTMHFLIIQVQLATKKIKSLVTMLTVARTMMLVSLLIQKIGQMILVSFVKITIFLACAENFHNSHVTFIFIKL